MSIDYAQLDAAIIEHLVRHGASTFGSLLSHLEPLADSITPPKFGGQRNGWRSIDQRLWVLRKAGRINPVRRGRNSFWVLSAEGGAA